MFVIKANGEKEVFDKSKVERTAIKAGATKDFAREVANKVEAEIYDGIPTKTVLKIALKFLRKHKTVAEKYSLKKAIMELGPTGFPFENYFAKILENYGYTTKVGIFLKGARVRHEVDVLATKDSKTSMIECKYHNSLGVHTNIKVAMYTYARFLDVRKHAQEGWLVTNTKCTHSAIQYANGVGLKIIGWGYPRKGNLQELIEKKKLYPITSLLSVKGHIKNTLSQAKIALVKELVELTVDELHEKTNLPRNDLLKIKRDAENLMNNHQ